MSEVSDTLKIPIKPGDLFKEINAPILSLFLNSNPFSK